MCTPWVLDVKSGVTNGYGIQIEAFQGLRRKAQIGEELRDCTWYNRGKGKAPRKMKNKVSFLLFGRKKKWAQIMDRSPLYSSASPSYKNCYSAFDQEPSRWENSPLRPYVLLHKPDPYSQPIDFWFRSPSLLSIQFELIRKIKKRLP